MSFLGQLVNIAGEKEQNGALYKSVVADSNFLNFPRFFPIFPGKWAGRDCVGHKTGVMQTNGGEYRRWFFWRSVIFLALKDRFLRCWKTTILRYRQFLQRSQTFRVLLSIFPVMFGLCTMYFVFMWDPTLLYSIFDLFIFRFMGDLKV